MASDHEPDRFFSIYCLACPPKARFKLEELSQGGADRRVIVGYSYVDHRWMVSPIDQSVITLRAAPREGQGRGQIVVAISTSDPPVEVDDRD